MHSRFHNAGIDGGPLVVIAGPVLAGKHSFPTVRCRSRRVVFLAHVLGVHRCWSDEERRRYSPNSRYREGGRASEPAFAASFTAARLTTSMASLVVCLASRCMLPRERRGPCDTLFNCIQCTHADHRAARLPNISSQILPVWRARRVAKRDSVLRLPAFHDRQRIPIPDPASHLDVRMLGGVCDSDITRDQLSWSSASRSRTDSLRSVPRRPFPGRPDSDSEIACVELPAAWRSRFLGHRPSRDFEPTLLLSPPPLITSPPP